MPHYFNLMLFLLTFLETFIYWSKRGSFHPSLSFCLILIWGINPARGGGANKLTVTSPWVKHEMPRLHREQQGSNAENNYNTENCDPDRARSWRRLRQPSGCRRRKGRHSVEKYRETVINRRSRGKRPWRSMSPPILNISPFQLHTFKEQVRTIIHILLSIKTTWWERKWLLSDVEINNMMNGKDPDTSWSHGRVFVRILNDTLWKR